MFCPAVLLLFYYFFYCYYYYIIIIIIIIIVRFLFVYVCVGACTLPLIFKLRKSIKTFNNILNLPDLCLRLSRSSFFTSFLVRDGFRYWFWFKVFDLIYISLAILFSIYILHFS